MSDAPDLIRSARFRREREAGWRRLEVLLNRVERKGAGALDFAEAQELAAMYRSAVNALSVAREISLDKTLQDYLEALCCRGYLAIYAPQESARGVLWRFLSQSGPAAVRRSGVALALAAFSLILGAAIGYLLFFDDPTWYNTFIPASMQQGRGLSSSPEQLLAAIYGHENEDGGALAAFAAFLFSHNARIAIFAFSLGVMACAPSFLLTAYNGLILGAFFALHVDRGVGYDLFAWLSIHGVTELSAIVLATAGGFRLGLSVLFPGRLTRRAALRRTGPDAAKLAVMAGVMLAAAAILEGFGRQLITDPQARLAIGWGAGALWLLYFLRAGRPS